MVASGETVPDPVESHTVASAYLANAGYGARPDIKRRRTRRWRRGVAPFRRR